MPSETIFKLKRIRSRGNLAEKVYQRLKEAIIRGHLPPGCLLQEQLVTKAMSISRTPLREAFNRLKAEGLIEVTTHKGARVVELNAGELDDLFEAREAIETLFFERSAKNISKESLLKIRDDLVQAEEKIHQAVDPEEREQAMHHYLRLDRAFHDELITASGNKYWQKVYLNIRDRIEICGYQASQKDDFQIVMDQHLAIIDALLQGETDEACRIMRRHITAMRKRVEDFAKELHPQSQGGRPE
ncbi:GntR family transcriptional regulator [Dethiosulfatarculus sandiegensis]|uniref:HTH gntR-type domain-containing protein n=1 Tax=Dethiosulfatarculus sandiegensis TaxID=1429043 RepID=A0A0D2JTJ4_9BACT|nr:GntR family transcriptional regulator [Dethiosulfatarculus sandiegensis]KIX12830.1 hypothetical protein X474_17050 [Dethiosulfatarculus sandiegensis]